MNKRDVFLPSLSTLTVLGMMVFYSCAHQNRVQDELDVATDEETSEIKQAESETKDTASEVQQTASNDLDMTQMGLEENGHEAEKKVEEAKTELETSVTEGKDAVSDVEIATLGTGTDPTATTESTNSLPATDPLTELGETAPATAVIAEADKTVEEKPLENIQAETVLTEPTLKDTTVAPEEPALIKPEPAKKSAGMGSLKVPKIPSKPIVKNGTSLNRFYFVRKGDTPQSVSEMIYGSDSHAADLQKWNPTSQWSPGHIVYYSSPSNPQDTQIGSFYRENSVEAEEYTVEKGDWISKIAFKKLGSPESWREVAVINGMSRPDKIEVGQKIAIYPKDLSKFGGGVAVATNPAPAPVHVPEPVVVENNLNKPPQLADANPHMPETPPQQVPPPSIPNEVQNIAPEPPPHEAEMMKPVPKQPKGFDASKVVEQNLPAAVILAGVLILSAAYLAVRKRKVAKQHAEDFDEIPSSRSNRK